MNKSSKFLVNMLVVMTLVFSLSITPGAASSEEGKFSAKLQNYEIVDTSTTGVANLQIKHQDTDTHLIFDFLDEHTVEVLANFYTLEGAALSANTYLADIKESNYELLHLSISTESKLLNKDISLNEGDVLLNLAI